jgi:hypothetical protein
MTNSRKRRMARQRYTSHKQRRRARIISCSRSISPEEKEALTSNEMEAAIESDRRWFKKHPDRNYGIRHMTEPEITATGRTKPLDHRWYMIVRQVRRGFRFRLEVSMPPLSHPENFSEAECQLLYEEHAARLPPDIITAQAQLVEGLS